VSEPSKPAPAPAPHWPGAVVIPTTWTPEQALAVFELLDELREKIWNRYSGQMQELMAEQQHHPDLDDASAGPHDTAF
jgi:hypothetical protein